MKSPIVFAAVVGIGVGFAAASYLFLERGESGLFDKVVGSMELLAASALPSKENAAASTGDKSDATADGTSAAGGSSPAAAALEDDVRPTSESDTAATDSLPQSNEMALAAAGAAVAELEPQAGQGESAIASKSANDSSQEPETSLAVPQPPKAESAQHGALEASALTGEVESSATTNGAVQKLTEKVESLVAEAAGALDKLTRPVEVPQAHSEDQGKTNGLAGDGKAVTIALAPRDGSTANGKVSSGSEADVSGDSGASRPQVAALSDDSEMAAKPVPPSFDVVRVDAGGGAVIAGRAAPGSEVTLLANGEQLYTVIANMFGEWVLLPGSSFEPGHYQLTLAATLPEGHQVQSEDVVVVVVEQQPSGGADVTGEANVSSLAVLMDESGKKSSRVLRASRGDGIREGVLVLASVDYDASGRMIVGGSAPEGARLLVYLDNRLIGRAVAQVDGRWQIIADQPVDQVLHRLRVDQLAEDGHVVARVETPFMRSLVLTDVPDDEFFVVQPGNSLWRIARRTYGRGVRYTVVYEANKDQIADPDLIYPGQIFVLPSVN